MGMPVMDIRKVRVTVAHLHMVVNMAVCAGPAPLESMVVLVVLIVNMPVCVGHWHVLMLMSVTFGEVKPHANTHQDRRFSSHGHAPIGQGSDPDHFPGRASLRATQGARRAREVWQAACWHRTTQRRPERGECWDSWVIPSRDEWVGILSYGCFAQTFCGAGQRHAIES